MRRKNVTMKDIANRLGISINAVSLALNDRSGIGEETKRRILDTAEELGYLEQSVKYAKTYSNKNICILLKHRFFRDFRFYGRILLGIEEEAKKSGYDVFINSFDTEEVPACVEGHKVSGIIVLGKIEDTFLKRLKCYQLPVVLADYMSLEESTDSVVSDNRLGAYKMTTYLLDAGYTRIGYFGDTEYTPSTRDRFLGYQEAMQHYLHLGSFQESIRYVEQFSILTDVENYVICQDAEGLYGKFNKINTKPEALFCSNDELAVFLMRILQKKGYSIPEDIAIAGFDDIELSKMVTPALTTVHVQKKLMGKKAMQCLLHRMTHPNEEIEKTIMDVKIIERDSVRKHIINI